MERKEGALAWRWNAWRLAISAYLVLHLTATLAWVVPPSPIKALLMPKFRFYMLPCGLWQSWGMFAPDPMNSTIVLESEVIDAKGMRHAYEFTKVADLPWMSKMPRFRHPKLAANLLVDEYSAQREMVARHVVRQLDIPADAFPVQVALFYKVTAPPPIGSAESDPMAPAQISNLAAFEFQTWSEVHR